MSTLPAYNAISLSAICSSYAWVKSKQEDQSTNNELIQKGLNALAIAINAFAIGYLIYTTDNSMLGGGSEWFSLLVTTVPLASALLIDNPNSLPLHITSHVIAFIFAVHHIDGKSGPRHWAGLAMSGAHLGARGISSYMSSSQSISEWSPPVDQPSYVPSTHSVKPLEALSSAQKKCVVLDGLPQSGRTATLNYLASQIKEGKAPTLRGSKVFNVNLLLWQTCQSYTYEIEKTIFPYQKVVLLIDNIDQIEWTNHWILPQLANLLQKHPHIRLIATMNSQSDAVSVFGDAKTPILKRCQELHSLSTVVTTSKLPPDAVKAISLQKLTEYRNSQWISETPSEALAEQILKKVQEEAPRTSDLLPTTLNFLDRLMCKCRTSGNSGITSALNTTPVIDIQHNPKLPEGLTDLLLEVKEEKKRRGEGARFEPRKEVERVLFGVLNQDDMRNAILVGDAGTGKTALIKHIAERVAENQVPERLKGCMVLKLCLTTLQQDTKYFGTFEKKVKKIFNYLAAFKNVILFVDEFHRISQLGAHEHNQSNTLPNMLKEQLPHIMMIGATTPHEFHQHLKGDSAFMRRFTEIEVPHLTDPEVLSITKGKIQALAEAQDIVIDEEQLDTQVSQFIERFKTKFHRVNPAQIEKILQRELGLLRVDKGDKSQTPLVEFMEIVTRDLPQVYDRNDELYGGA